MPRTGIEAASPEVTGVGCESTMEEGEEGRG